MGDAALVPEPIPEKLFEGKFTLYKTPSGGMHLTMRVDGEEEDRHFEVPSLMLKMMGGNPLFSALRKQV